ncbi:DUF2938 domain-containing protein [Citrobacter sp. JGM124]|nr:DUF2938 domain-containing protein [Citrobacter sp. JGM124]
MSEPWINIVWIGIGATVTMDIWAVIQKMLGMPVLNYALVGRWIGHCCRGQLMHQNIRQAAIIPGECVSGWVIHYATGVVFAILLIEIQGVAWLSAPTLLPAVLVGVITVLFPFLVMQPGMGAGIAATRTATPWKNRLRSVVTHGVFGAGLYFSAVLIVWINHP